MNFILRAGAGVLLVAASGAANAQYGERPIKQCLSETGERHATWHRQCPPGMTEIKTRIVTCTLPDGSRAFGNQCPKEATQTERLQEDELARRSSGASSKEGTRETLQQARDRELNEQRAERMREWEADRAQATAEAELRRAEQAAAAAAQAEAARPRPRVRGN